MSENEQPLSPEERRARREAQVIKGREVVARSRALLEEGQELRAAMGVTSKQIAAFMAERYAVTKELFLLKGKKRKKSRRVRTAV